MRTDTIGSVLARASSAAVRGMAGAQERALRAGVAERWHEREAACRALFALAEVDLSARSALRYLHNPAHGHPRRDVLRAMLADVRFAIRDAASANRDAELERDIAGERA
jgi:hypothetical protein